MREDREPRRLANVLDELAPRLGVDRAVDTGRLWARWRDIVGGPVARHAQPSSLRHGVLRVRVDSPAWATEIGYLADEIRRNANGVLGRVVVSEVRVWVGTGSRLERAAGAAERDGTSTTEPPPRRAAGADPVAALERARRAWTSRVRGSR